MASSSSLPSLPGMVRRVPSSSEDRCCKLKMWLTMSGGSSDTSIVFALSPHGISIGPKSKPTVTHAYFYLQTLTWGYLVHLGVDVLNQNAAVPD
jgi:hypothetical protein